MNDYDLLSLPFDQYQRHRCPAEIINSLPLEEHPLVLDVGGYSRLSPDEDFLLLPRFLPNCRVVVLDRQFCSVPGYVQGNGLNLPFADKAFSCVVSVDALEHVSPDARANFIDELMRVTGFCLVLAAPFADEVTEAAERLVFDYSAAVLGVGHPQIGEHLTLGLPDLARWRDHLEARGWSVVEIANGYLPRWSLMMLARHYLLSLPDGAELCPQIDRLYNTVYYQLDQRLPAYRRVLVSSRSSSTLDLLRYAFSETDEDQISEDDLRRLMVASVWRDIVQSVERQYAQIVGLQDYAQSLENEIRHRDEVVTHLRSRIAAFERGRFIRFMSWLRQWRRQLWHRVRGAGDGRF